MNQNKEKQEIKATEQKEKKGQLTPGQYNTLYSKIGKVICNLCPEILEAWKEQNSESENKVDAKLEEISLVQNYSSAHPRFVESLKSGLLH